MNDLDRELSRSIRVDPLPDFAARVRARIASEPRAFRWGVPRLAIATIGAIAVGIAASNLLLLNRDSASPSKLIVLEHQKLIVIAPLRSPVSAVQHQESSSRVPQVVISKSEMLALRQLFSGAIVAPPATPVADELTISELVIEPIAMPSIPEGERQ